MLDGTSSGFNDCFVITWVEETWFCINVFIIWSSLCFFGIDEGGDECHDYAAAMVMTNMSMSNHILVYR